MGFARQIAALLFIIALPVALLTTTVRVVVNEPRLYEYVTDEYNTTATTGFERSELLRASSELRDYFNNSDESIFVSVQGSGGPESLFNPRETEHLRNVKALFQLSFLVQEATALFVLAYVVAVFIWPKESSFRPLAKQVFTSWLAMLLVVGALGVAAFTDFHAAWDQFHVIAFNNDLWMLNPSRDHLIQMFPEPFWQDVVIWIGVGVLAEISALGLLSAIYLRVTKDAQVSVTLAASAQPFS